jgi:acyl-CoA synthetase (AMP-forming)/AMP-acid ligase II
METNAMITMSGLKSMGDLTRQQAKLRPNEIALVFEGRETTFAQLDKYASQVANGLIAEGVKPQGRVGYMGKNSDIYFEMTMGSYKANAVVVGVNWRLAGPEVEYVVNDAHCEVLFVTSEFYGLIEKCLPNMKSVRKLIAIDGGHASWESFAAWRDRQKTDDPNLAVKMDDTAIQLYTSGTTGHPKGVELTNANYFGVFEALSNDPNSGLNWNAGDVTMVCMPVFHVAGVNIGVLSIAQGCKGVVLKDIDPTKILQLIEQYKINHAFFVPAVILFLTQHPLAKTTNFKSLQNISYGASPIAEDLLVKAKDVFGCKFSQLFGLTETSGAGTWLAPEDHDPAKKKLRSCGKPLPGLQLRIVDGAGKDVPVGDVGEIILKGPTIMKGYWNKPEATAKSIVNGWFYTGDAGYLDKDGFVFIHDRVKDMIVSGGENIYPAEVENAVFGHPAVADVAVIGVPDEKWGEAVKAMVVLKPGAEATSADIIGWARDRIAGYKLPKSVDFIQALPRNPSGKILRRELREPFWKGRERRVN